MPAHLVEFNGDCSDSMEIKVAIVEDKTGVRQNWARLINAATGFRCVATCASGEDALLTLPEARPQVILMDIQLPGISGIECAARLKPLLPATQILIVTIYEDADRIFEALKAGASGYLLKTTPPKELLAAIAEVHRGGAPMTGEVARKVIAAFQRPAPAATEDVHLSKRETEVLALLSQGYANKEIADRLAVSYDTVRAHLKHTYEKLHVRSRTEAVAKYFTRNPTGPTPPDTN
jgi:DNA-binding NarL/FixJ family response regulator